MAVRMMEMRRLYLLRHAKSSWDDPALDDFERCLNARGREAARAMGRHMVAAAIRPDMVLCSSAKRTRETWAIVSKGLAGVPVSFEGGLYAAAKGDLLKRLRLLDDHLRSALVIGHNPGLERLAAALSAGHGDSAAIARMEVKFPTCTLAVLECEIGHWAELEAGSCHLTAFVRPKDLP